MIWCNISCLQTFYKKILIYHFWFFLHNLIFFKIFFRHWPFYSREVSFEHSMVKFHLLLPLPVSFSGLSRFLHCGTCWDSWCNFVWCNMQHMYIINFMVFHRSLFYIAFVIFEDDILIERWTIICFTCRKLEMENEELTYVWISKESQV